MAHTLVSSAHTSTRPRRIPTYVKVVCAYKPHKADPYRVRMTVGGNRVDCHGKMETKTADLPVTKAIINSVISTKAALYMSMDIKNYYLGIPLGRYEYVKIPGSMVPNRITEEYNLYDLIHSDLPYAPCYS
jgi:hypothetical protein